MLSIRAARADEIEAIFAVHRDSVRSLCAGHYTPAQIAMWLEGRTPAMYLDAIATGQLWVAVDGPAVAGFVENDGHEVAKLFVAGAYASAGVGRQLLAHALAAIRAGGHARAYLEATRNACGFYRKHGFVEIGTGLFSRGNSGVALEIVKMELALA
jgi:GNAT superfamily N-acetyltransferase